MDRRHPGLPAELFRAPPAYPNMSIGLLGGTFDPPHAGHVHVSEMALQRLGLDRLWWLVTPGNPLKTHRDVTSFTDRLNAARAFVRHPRVEVTGFEATAGSTYTADTIAILKRHYPHTQFIWIMGADNLVEFHRWERWREIMQAVPIAVMDRPGYRMAARASRTARCYANAYVEESDVPGLKRIMPPAWAFLTVPLSPLSSTALRNNKLTRN